MARKKKPSGRKSRTRSVRDLQRIPGVRAPLKVVIVYCEGLKTEQNYFSSLKKELRLRSVSIRIVGKGKAPISIVQDASQAKMEVDGAHDEIWCVFDTESENKQVNIGAAIELAERNAIRLAISNPAFEYWFFIHFECSDRAFTDAQDLINSLRQHLPNYARTDDVFSVIWGMTGNAIANAESLRRRAANPWEELPNPSTQVDVLVSHLMSFG